jgi:glutamate formiminotransferase / formiminotetrahydrofolate cyclodeaminase
MKLLECVPNFSDGRRPEVVDALCAEVGAVAGVKVIDRSSDADHNRSVVTFVGPPDAVVDAAFRAIRKAAELIDLRDHQGAHPRMGATDVCPFVPLGDATMEDCVAAAKSLGERVGRELAIPVYLYAEAAARPERRDLAAVRSGQFEGLRDAIGKDPARDPDFGPRAIHASAGCTAIGARFFLVAYNVNLDTDDVALARRIAKEIREKDGGLPGVKALGFELADRKLAQVSMNLVDYRRTSPGRAFDEVRRRAGAAGVEVLESEVVGLLPQAAVTQSFVDLTRPREWTDRQVLENLLGPVDPLDACAPFLAQLASDSPTPGGGSAAALAGAMGAALVVMVCNLTVGRDRFKAVDAELRDVHARATRLQAEMSSLVRRDAQAYAGFVAAMKLPKATDAEKAARKQAMGEAAVLAAEVPLQTMRVALEVMRLAAVVAKKGNPHAASDGAVGALLGRAALRSADMNVRINLPSIPEESVRARMLAEAESLVRETEEIERAAIAATGLV